MENKTYDLAYWINERESIRMRREAGAPAPWTTNPVMAKVRYCNVHREDDKVTKYIRNSGIYSGPDVPVWVVVLARMVNRIATLETIGCFVNGNNLPDIKRALKTLRKGAPGQIYPIWGNAYTISTCGKSMDKVDYVIDWVVQAFAQAGDPDFTSCRETFDQLVCVDGFGSFLAAQVIADLKNTVGHPLNTAPDWWTWSAHGPGSLRGLTAYFGSKITPALYEEAITTCYDEVRPLLADYVGELHMQDFQNTLCEFSKFIRVRDGDGHARNTYAAR